LPFGVPLPPLMSCTKVTYDTEQSESALSESGQGDVKPSSEGTVMSEAIGSDIGPKMQAAGLPKRSKLWDNPQVADAMAHEPQQTYRPWEPAGVLPPICPQPVYTSEILATRTVHEMVATQSLLTMRHPPSHIFKTSRPVTAEQRSPHDSVHEWLTTATAAGVLALPPSQVTSRTVSRVSTKHSTLLLGADAALISPGHSL